MSCINIQVFQTCSIILHFKLEPAVLSFPYPLPSSLIDSPLNTFSFQLSAGLSDTFQVAVLNISVV